MFVDGLGPGIDWTLPKFDFAVAEAKVVAAMCGSINKAAADVSGDLPSFSSGSMAEGVTSQRSTRYDGRESGDIKADDLDFSALEVRARAAAAAGDKLKKDVAAYPVHPSVLKRMIRMELGFMTSEDKTTRLGFFHSDGSWGFADGRDDAFTPEIREIMLGTVTPSFPAIRGLSRCGMYLGHASGNPERAAVLMDMSDEDLEVRINNWRLASDTAPEECNLRALATRTFEYLSAEMGRREKLEEETDIPKNQPTPQDIRDNLEKIIGSHPMPTLEGHWLRIARTGELLWFPYNTGSDSTGKHWRSGQAFNFEIKCVDTMDVTKVEALANWLEGNSSNREAAQAIIFDKFLANLRRRLKKL